MTPNKVNCWEHMHCGCEPGGPNAGVSGPCPAATDTSCDGINGGKDAGRFCWVIPGTLCRGATQGGPQEKTTDCQQCSFFRLVKYEEGCHFQLIEPGLGTTDATQLHRLLNNIVILIGMCRDVLACLAIQPLLSRIAEHLCTVTRSSSASAYLMDNSGKLLVLKAHAGIVDRPARIGLDENVPASEAVRTSRLCKGSVVLDGHAAPAFVAVIPTGASGQPGGVLEVLKADEPFSADDEWFLREFGLIAALGIENARHVEDLRQLKRFDKAKSRFVALLMHHITSPLATIACSLQALSQLGQKLPVEDREKLIGFSLERIQSIQTLARTLLDLAAIQRGSSLVDVQPILPAGVLQEEIKDRMARMQEKGVQIAMTQRGGESRISADPHGLRLILGNLLSNAIKYSTGTVARVDVELTTESGWVRVTVRDRGIGIPAEEQERIFDEFQRGSNVGETGASGFGLGLAAVKELVDRYGGRINLQSEVGVGTCISVEFPTLDEVGDESPSCQRPAAPGGPAQSP